MVLLTNTNCATTGTVGERGPRSRRVVAHVNGPLTAGDATGWRTQSMLIINAITLTRGDLTV
jgi:hypothetical protein